MKKINFRKGKYIYPLVLLLPFLFLCYQIFGIIDFDVPKEDQLEQTEGELNTSIPDPNMDNLALKSKYKNMMEDFGKVRDHAAVQVLDEEEKAANDGISDSLYDEAEIARLDSLDELKRKNIAEIERLQGMVVWQSDNEANNIPGNKASLSQNSSNDELLKQIELLQRVASGEKILTPEEIEKAEKAKEEEAERIRQAEEQRIENAPKEVIKADGHNSQYFNTVGDDSKNSNMIKAMLDETLRVVDGSRIRIRLLDDVVLNENVIPKGTYLYATINGFGSQRVKAKVQSILVADQQINVSLSIFDNDGLEGFYVPSSTFRDLAKNAGSAALGQNINMNSNSGNQDVETFAFQTLQSVYQSASSAVSQQIKKNKAKLKYNTIVYLINNKE